MIEKQTTKIKDVYLSQLKMHQDERGIFTEIFRENWFEGKVPVQWNIVSSEAGVFRGFHVHKLHADYLTVVQGQGVFFLKDLRKNSATFLVEETIVLTAKAMQGLSIPTGVAHAFYFPEQSMHVYSVTEYWNPEDELGFHYLDPETGFDFCNLTFSVSARDCELGSLSSLLEQLANTTFG